MIAQGKIYKILDTQQVTEKFRKREFVLEVTNNPAYVQKVLFTLILDNVSMLDGFNVGDEVSVKFNLKGKEWTSPNGDVKYFNTLEAETITSSSSGGGQAQNDDDLMKRVDTDSSGSGDDDLPF
jgi:hypothetical protein